MRDLFETLKVMLILTFYVTGAVTLYLLNRSNRMKTQECKAGEENGADRKHRHP